MSIGSGIIFEEFRLAAVARHARGQRAGDVATPAEPPCVVSDTVWRIVMRFAVIGLGIGQVHAQLVSKRPDLELVGVCDVDPQRAEKTAAECGTVAYTDWRAMLDEARPDAVSV